MIHAPRIALLVPAVVAGLLGGDAAAATESPGTVESVTSRWAADGHLIVTDVIVRAADGTQVTVTQLGGSVEGIGMAVSHQDASLQHGDRVVLVADDAQLRARRVMPAESARSAPRAAGAARFGVQRTSRSQRPLYHASGCLAFTYDASGTTSLADDREWAAVDAAFGAWESASAEQSCGSVQFTLDALPDAPDGRDGVNTVRFRDDTWCRPATATEPEVCHSPGAVAVTRVLYIDDPSSPRDGEIIEVDIEINAVDFTLAVDGRAGAIDLASAAAHEIGHALGLDHNCGIEGAVWPADLDGTLVESCESADPSLVVATMYVQVQPGAVSMREPKPSDLDGLCAVVEGACVYETTGGCAVGARGTSPTPFLGSLGLGLGLGLGLVVARRVRRRSLSGA